MRGLLRLLPRTSGGLSQGRGKRRGARDRCAARSGCCGAAESGCLLLLSEMGRGLLLVRGELVLQACERVDHRLLALDILASVGD